MGSQPLVSVGVPTYNRPKGLRRTLECITKQTYKNLEIIISDNCSTDSDVQRIIIEYKANDNRIKYYQQTENNGVLFNFSFVLKKATGEYFMWAADDDEWDKTFIEKCLNGFKISEKIVLVASGCDCYNSETGEFIYQYDILDTLGLTPLESFKKYAKNIYTNELRVAALIHGLFKKSVIDHIRFENLMGSDFIIVSEVAIQGEIYSIKENLIKKNRDRKKDYKNNTRIVLAQKLPYLFLTARLNNKIDNYSIGFLYKMDVFIFLCFHYIMHKLLFDIKNFINYSSSNKIHYRAE